MFKIKKMVVLLVVLVLVFGITNVHAEQNKQGGTFVFPLAYDNPVSLDPVIGTGINEGVVHTQIFDRLVVIDPELLEPVPAVAKEWEISDDKKTYTFHLNEGIKFHNGRELTAQDVKYSYERVMDLDGVSALTTLFNSVEGVEAYQDGSTDHISGIEVVDDYTIKIDLNRLDVTFLNTLANRGAAIVPKEVIEEKGDRFGTDPVGSGPFKFTSWRQGDRIVLEAYDDYYNGRPYLDRVEMPVMTEGASREAAFRTEEIDLDLVYPAQYETYKNLYSENLIEVPELWTRAMVFNLDREKFQDKRVRQAFNYAIDRDLIVDRLLMGKAYAAGSFLPTSSPAYNPDLESYNYNPEKAKELMREAGYGPDNLLEIEVIGEDHPAWGLQPLEVAQSDLREIGFDVKPVVLEGATITQRRAEGDFDAVTSSLGGQVSPLESMIGYFYSETSRPGGNYANYNNPKFDSYIEEAMQTADFEKRMELVSKAEAELLEDPPIWFYNYNRAVIAVQPWVNGIIQNPTDMLLQPLERVWIDDNSPRK